MDLIASPLAVAVREHRCTPRTALGVSVRAMLVQLLILPIEDPSALTLPLRPEHAVELQAFNDASERFLWAQDDQSASASEGGI